jgi:hypothetical protein
MQSHPFSQEGDILLIQRRYSGVRRQQQQDFPPLTSSSNKYTPPARRAPTGQSTVSGAPVDPAIISSQLARPEKASAPAETAKVAPTPKAAKPEVATPPTTTEPSFTATPEPKAAIPPTSSSASRTASPQVKPEVAANATATVERDVSQAFKTFAVQQRKNVDQLRLTRIRNDKEIKLNDLKKFADSFKLTTPVPSDLVSIIAKDPAKQKEIQEKAKRNAEESKANPEAAKPVVPVPEAKAAQRPTPATHVSSPSNPQNRQNTARNAAFGNSGAYRGSSQAPQPIPQPARGPALGRNLRASESMTANKISQPSPAHEARLPPTGPANSVDPNFSRRSSGVASAQGPRLNPNSSEFRPSPHAATFSPHGNPSSGSSPRSSVNAPAPVATPITRSLLRRKPAKPAERAKLTDKFDALSHIKTLKPAPEKKWDLNGGMKPAYDTHPAWRQVIGEEKPDSTMHLTYTKLFEMAPFPAQPMSSPGPANVMPQQPHQHQLPFHLQQGGHGMQPGRSPRAPPMNMHGNQLGHGPVPPFGGHDDHRMIPSHSAQSYGSPRVQNVNMAYASPMNQPAQLAYNPQMMHYGAPPMQPQFRSLSQSHGYMPQQGPMGPIMMQNPAGGFLTSQGMAPGPQMMYPQGQAPFMPQGNGHPPPMQPNGFPNSPGRTAPMMMSQGSQQGHQQPMYGMNPGMSPGPQYGNVAPIYAQQPPGGSTFISATYKSRC